MRTRKIETDFDKSFKGISGKEYRLGDISSGRLAYIQEMSLILLNCQDTLDVVEYNNKIIELCNSGKVGDIAILAYNRNKGQESLSNQTNAVMKYCAALFNYEGEDESKVDENDFDKKIEDWADIEATFFFTACLGTVSGLLQRWQQLAESSEVIKGDLERLLISYSKITRNSGGASSG